MKSYTVTEEDLNALQDYFDAALCGSDSLAKLHHHWQVQMQIIKSNTIE
jgi:hypothetical protein